MQINVQFGGAWAHWTLKQVNQHDLCLCYQGNMQNALLNYGSEVEYYHAKKYKIMLNMPVHAVPCHADASYVLGDYI